MIREFFHLTDIAKMFGNYPLPHQMDLVTAGQYRNHMFKEWLAEHDCTLDHYNDRDSPKAYVAIYFPDKPTQMLFKLTWHV